MADQLPDDEQLAELVHGPAVEHKPVPSTGGRLVIHEDGTHRFPPVPPRSETP